MDNLDFGNYKIYAKLSMGHTRIIGLGILIFILFGIAGYVIYRNPKTGKWINISKAPTERCDTCANVWEESCPRNYSCIVPIGASSGICLPSPKMGQTYTNSQINRYCRTNFPENVVGINSEEEAIIRVKTAYPEVKDVKKTSDIIGKSMNISAKETELGWKLMFWQGSGDCPAGCINNHYWYFIVYKNGKVEKIGEYEKTYNSRKNSADETGSPIWDFLEKD